MDNASLEPGLWSDQRFSIEEIEAALDHSEAALRSGIVGSLPAGHVVSSNVVPISERTPRSRRAAFRSTSIENAKAGLGSEWHWLADLTIDELDAFVTEIAADPRMQPLADVERPEWLKVLFGFAAAAAAGAAAACKAARAWSQTSPRYLNDADFDRDWRSYNPARPKGITIGTLAHHAKGVGIDLEPWRARVRARTQSGEQPARGAPISQLPNIMSTAAATAHLNAGCSPRSAGARNPVSAVSTTMDQCIV